MSDIHHMKSALSLAGRGLGRTAPNPSVGCVIVKDGIIIARARTNDGGRPHAESTALSQAGAAAKGASLYVTLEPCAHHGQTPPCVDTIIDAGINRVIIGSKDVDPRTCGKSIQKLKDAGIEVITGILEDECNTLNAGFFSKITKNRPLVTLKMACSMDGKIALASGESQWITGTQARAHVHQIRSRHDAILVGVGTVIADNPSLTTRIDGLSHDVVRVVLDSDLSIPLDSKLVSTASNTPLCILHNANPRKGVGNALDKMGARLHETDCNNLVSVLELLAEQGITRLLVEGGAQIHASFLRVNICDELLIYRAPQIFGGGAKSAFADLDVDILSNSYKFEQVSVQKLGDDVLESYSYRHPSGFA